MKTMRVSLAIENVGIAHKSHRYCVLVPEAMSLMTTVPASEILTTLSGPKNVYAIVVELGNRKSPDCH
jgi:hypothetical protein